MPTPMSDVGRKRTCPRYSLANNLVARLAGMHAPSRDDMMHLRAIGHNKTRPLAVFFLFTD